jgi:uncharacterized repeat protein (TIGR03803 family)
MNTTNSPRPWIAQIIAAAFLALTLATGAATGARAQTFTVLYNFTNAPDGIFPFAGLLIDAAGNFYGTTEAGGLFFNGGCGTVFKLDPSGTETVLYRFCEVPLDAADPFAPLIGDAAGNLYGTTRDGGIHGFGTVFKVDTSGNETVLHNFAADLSEGVSPEGGLIMDAAGNLYGTTPFGGASGQAGSETVFKLDTALNLKVLHNFTGSDEANPLAGLIMDAAGNLYGTTGGGGAFGFGTVFKLDKSGNLMVLYSFKGPPADGGAPYAGLIMDAAGNLYGTTLGGGSGTSSTCQDSGVNGCGTVFKAAPAPVLAQTQS